MAGGLASQLKGLVKKQTMIIKSGGSPATTGVKNSLAEPRLSLGSLLASKEIGNKEERDNSPHPSD